MELKKSRKLQIWPQKSQTGNPALYYLLAKLRIATVTDWKTKYSSLKRRKMKIRSKDIVAATRPNG